MNFGETIKALKDGKCVAREGWNGKDMFLYLVDGSRFTVNREPLVSIFGEGTEVSYRPHIDMKGSDGSISTWTPSQTDIFANDWYTL